jgi:hypothetical protein
MTDATQLPEKPHLSRIDETLASVRKFAANTLSETEEAATLALHSAVYEGLQQPLTGLSQVCDRLTGSKIADSTHFIPAPDAATFGTLNWHAEQLGGAVGQLLPFMLSRHIIKPIFSNEAAAAAKLAQLSKVAPIGLSIKEAAATGFVSQGLFHPTNDDENFWTHRLINGGNGAITMTALTAATFGFNELASRKTANGFEALAVLKNPVANGIASGALAGLLNGELNAVELKRRFADRSEIEKSIYGSIVVGGALGSLALHQNSAVKGTGSEARLANETDGQGASRNETSLSTRSETSVAARSEIKPSTSDEPQVAIEAQTKIPVTRGETSANPDLSIPREASATVIAAETPAQLPLQLDMPANLAPLKEVTVNGAAIAEPKLESSKPPEQYELQFPDPLTPLGQKAWKLLQRLEDMPRDENVKLGDQEYPVSVEEMQAMHILKNEWWQGSHRLYYKLGERSSTAYSMVSEGWNIESASDVKGSFQKVFERALLFSNEANKFDSRDQFVGIGRHPVEIGFKTPEETKALIDLFTRTKPSNPWLWSGMDVDPVYLFKMSKWSAIDSIPDSALRGITEHFYRAKQNPSESEHDLPSLLAAAPGWDVIPSLPIDMATAVAKMSPHEKVAAQLAFEKAVVEIKSPGESAHQKFTGERANEARAAFTGYFDESVGLSTRELIKQLYADFGLPNAVKALHGDTLSPDQQRELVIGLDMFNDAPKLLASIDVPTFFKAFDKLVEEHPIEKVYESKNYYGWQNRTAMVLASVFKKNWQNWLDIQQKAGRTPSQATDFLYAQEPASIKGLGQFLMTHGRKAPGQLSSIADGWSEVRKAEAEDYKDALKIALRARFENVKNDDFAEEAARWNVLQKDYANMEERYLASLSVPSPFPLGQSWSSGNLTGRFIPRDDPRGLFLGEYSNCCQHPGGNAESSAWYGQENPRSGFFVIENAEHEIVAQSWAIATEDGGMMFDNVEAKGIDKRQQAVADIYTEAAQSLLSQFHTVTMGTENSDLNVSSFKPAGKKSLTMPTDFSGYTDSKSQVLLATNPDLTPKPVAHATVRGATNLDKPVMAKISQERFPDGWQHLPWERYTRGLVVQNKDREVMGYALYEPGNRYISDLAVKPDAHSSYGVSLTGNLLKQLRALGGEWTADMRLSTSYRLVQKAAKYGQLQIVSDELEDTPMGDEPMHHVTFKVARVNSASEEQSDTKKDTP